MKSIRGNCQHIQFMCPCRSLHSVAAVAPLPTGKVSPVSSSASGHAQHWFLFIFPPPTSFASINQKSFIKSFHQAAAWFLLQTALSKEESKCWAIWPCMPFFLSSQHVCKRCHEYHTSYVTGLHGSLHFCHSLNHTSSWSHPVLHWPCRSWRLAEELPCRAWGRACRNHATLALRRRHMPLLSSLLLPG